MKDKQLDELKQLINGVQNQRTLVSEQAKHVEHITGLLPQEFRTAEQCPNWSTDLLKAGHNSGDVRVLYSNVMKHWIDLHSRLVSMESDLTKYLQVVVLPPKQD